MTKQDCIDSLLDSEVGIHFSWVLFLDPQASVWENNQMTFDCSQGVASHNVSKIGLHIV